MDFLKEVEQMKPAGLTGRAMNRWEKTGLLEGLSKSDKEMMTVLLENQALEERRKLEVITEASQVADIKGFQNIAFPVVRRVFAGLLAHDLVAIQPMSLPAGLLFYLDFTYDTKKAGDKNETEDYATGGSLYGSFNGPNARGGLSSNATGGHYNYGTSYSQREIVGSGSYTITSGSVVASDVDYDPYFVDDLGDLMKITITGVVADAEDNVGDFAIYNGDLTNFHHWVPLSTGSTPTNTGVGTISPGIPARLHAHLEMQRQFTKIVGDDLVVIAKSVGWTGADTLPATCVMSYVQKTALASDTSGTILANTLESDFNDPSSVELPEISLRIQSIPVVTQTRKLKIRWTPELSQDMTAYLNMDPEVELTTILSEQIALDIDREIVSDLVDNASAATFHWSRIPGKFVNKNTGAVVTTDKYVARSQAEWYQTLIETINDVANQIHKKTLRGAANFLVCSPDVATILESTGPYWQAVAKEESNQYLIGAEKLGTLATRYTVYKDPYMKPNTILVGYKGKTFLDTGFIYAPYVPLITTPTIYHPEDFTPRKGAMTRYAKTMVRSDFYGKVVVQDMSIF